MPPNDPGPVVFVLRELAVGGLERVVIEQARWFVDQGHPVTLVLIRPRHNPLIAEVDPRCRVVALQGTLPHRLRTLRASVRGADAIVHFGYGRLNVLHRVAMHGARTTRFVHSDYRRLRGPVSNTVDRWVADHLDDAVVAVGGSATEFLASVVRLPRTDFVSLGNCLWPPQPAPGQGGIRLVCVADLEEHKRQSTLITGLAAMGDDARRFSLWLVGQGSQDLALWQLAQDLGVSDRVVMLGGVWNRWLVRTVLEGADVYVSMSAAEGVPISVLEAVRAGMPMVLSDIEGHRAAAEGGTACFVPVDSPLEFASACVEVASKPGENAGSPDEWEDRWSRYMQGVREIVVGR